MVTRNRGGRMGWGFRVRMSRRLGTCTYFLGGISGREGLFTFVFPGTRAQGLGEVVMEWGMEG